MTKKRRNNKNRSDARYTAKDFQAMPEEIQLMLAHEYLLRPAKAFDDGTFRFSRAKFYRLCKKLGFGKTYVTADALEAIRKAYNDWKEAEGQKPKE